MSFYNFLKPNATVRQQLRAGFTMIELLVVMAILGTLVATFAMSTSSARENAKIVKATAESRSLENAIRLFCMSMTDTELETDGGNQLSVLGLGDGLQEANPTLTNMLTKPSQSNGNTVYYEANDSSIRGNRLCDPWGHPYQIRVRLVNRASNVAEEEDYEIVVPLPGRHRSLKPLSAPSSQQ
jgi:prepilin-type N-terminal cleavage/methylation domain-containing protein